MSDISLQVLSDVAETLIIPLYVRALESRRPDALIKDEHAVALIERLHIDETQIAQADVSEETRMALILRSREFDRRTRDFLARHPDAAVVYIGCGLDARFERVDNGQVVWHDLDLPEVIDLRRKLMGGEGERHHFLACSVFETAWMDTVSAERQRPFLFLAEGVLMFFDEAQVKFLVLALRAHFPGAELILDAFSPFFVWANNRRVARTHIGVRSQWGLKHGADLESWGEGIRLLDEWFPYRCREPRLGRVRWVRWIPFLTRVVGVFHYRLGEAA